MSFVLETPPIAVMEALDSAWRELWIFIVKVFKKNSRQVVESVPQEVSQKKQTTQCAVQLVSERLNHDCYATKALRATKVCITYAS